MGSSPMYLPINVIVGSMEQQHVCLFCNKKISVPDKRQKYCNKECWRESVKRARIKKCPYCCTEFVYKDSRQKFCSSSCAASDNNAHRRRKVVPPKTCAQCGRELHNGQKKFCSRNCISQYNTAKEYANVGTKKQLTARLKKTILKEAEYTCISCGLSQIWNGRPITLQIHHVDGNPRNNRVENLQVLCPNCHSQTDNHGNKKRVRVP